MKEFILSILVFIICFPGNMRGQVTIGTDAPPHESAVLELVSSDKGFLAPRIQLSSTRDQTKINNPADGLLIFNTIDSDAAVPDTEKVFADKYYYWSASLAQWVEIIDQDVLENSITEALSGLGVPRPAIFKVEGSDDIAGGGKGINDILYNVNYGQKIKIPFVEEVNKISEFVSLGTDIDGFATVTFKPGIYSIVFSFKFMASSTAPNCTNSSYFMQFPLDLSAGDDRARIHCNVPHATYANGHHGGSINYVARLTNEYTWNIMFGPGQAGNCLSNYKGTRGYALANDGSFLYILRIGDY